MKKYKSLLTVILALLLTLSYTSCVDLNQEPISFYTQENYTPSPESFESLANGVFKTFRDGGITANGNYAFNCRVMALSLGGDDVIDGKRDRTRLTYLDQLNIQDYTDNDIRVMWNLLYTTVQASSTLIKDILVTEMPKEEIDNTYAGDTLQLEERFDAAECKRLMDAGVLENEQDVLTYLGEGYFMRALSYFYLTRFWGEVPCFANHLNTKSVDGTAAVQQQIPRTAVKDVYEKMIVRDLLLAIQLLPEMSRTEDNSRPNLWAAKTVLAAVYLHMAGWPLKDTEKYKDCYELCEDIINNSGYYLTRSFAQLWQLRRTTESNEHIFALHHYKEQNQAANYGLSYYATEENVNGEGWSDYLMDAEFYRRYPEDRRREVIAVTEFENEYIVNGQKQVRMLPYTQSSKRAPAIGKFRDYGDKMSAQTEGITPIYRFAEVYLMYAEAYNEYNQAPNAAARRYLREVRSRAGNDEDIPTSVGYAEFKQMVFDEYGWEFAIEGKRWFQLVRTETVVQQNQNNATVKEELDKRNIRTEADAQNGKGYLMPILSTAISDAQSVGVVITQNPGY